MRKGTCGHEDAGCDRVVGPSTPCSRRRYPDLRDLAVAPTDLRQPAVLRLAASSSNLVCDADPDTVPIAACHLHREPPTTSTGPRECHSVHGPIVVDTVASVRRRPVAAALRRSAMGTTDHDTQRARPESGTPDAPDAAAALATGAAS